MRATKHRAWRAAGLLALCALLLVPLAAPSGASAARLVSAKAVINRCGGDQLELTARAKPKKRVRGRRSTRRLRKFRRKIRRSRLEIQFRAVALFGDERVSRWIKADRGGRASHSFAGLPADTWSGYVRFRWRRGGRTRGSSFVNSSNGRVGGRRGRSLCSLGIGLPPRDSTPPFALIHPGDSAWRRPFTARIFAKDDFYGVAGTEYRINGGGLRQGPNVPLASTGTHRVDYRARDAAGNVAPFRRAVLRVDNSAPSAPVLDDSRGTLRFNKSGDTRPFFAWSASRDSGSGLKGYTIQIRDSAGRLVRSQTVSPSVRALRIGPPLGAGTYTVRVLATDNTTGAPHVTAGPTRRFTISLTPIYTNDFETTAKCEEFVLSGEWGCDDHAASSFSGRELGLTNLQRPLLGPNIHTATFERVFTAEQDQRYAISFARHAVFGGENDSAEIKVTIDGQRVRPFPESGRVLAAGRVFGISDPLDAGNRTLRLELVGTVRAGDGSTNFFLDDIFFTRFD